jgi:peptide/nickel transport system permease protein
MVVVCIFVSIITFVVIQLPPGDYLTSYVTSLEASGRQVSQEQLKALQIRYGLDRPMHIRYLKWITNFVRGDMGQSFEWNQPVNTLVWERLGLTAVISVSSLIFTWVVALPIGIISALKKHTFIDYFTTFLSFLGLAIPSFMLALVLMYVGFSYFDIHVGGLFSPEFQHAAWSWAKFKDLLAHLWVPTIVLGTGGTGGMVRIMRANLLDELDKLYVTAATARGLSPMRLIVKYPVRIAINPFISTIGWTLPEIISGATITSIVLNLPTTGPLLLGALRTQDMYLAGSFLMLLTILTVIGTLISDLLLALVDPRIRFE